MHPSIKIALGYDENEDEKQLLEDWKNKTSELCKPCWELQYCPYGPLVEDFPLLPITLEEGKEHNEYLSSCLKSGTLADGATLDADRRAIFIMMVEAFNEDNYPDVIPKVLLEASCNVFGHICPAFFVSEPLTETKNRRKHSRHIPRNVVLKVVRRDGQICQECNNPVPDDQVEFDHIIPFSKGGRSIVDNLRVVHKSCNRKKSASLKDILHENPIEHLWELREEDK